MTFWPYSLACPDHFTSLSLFSFEFCDAALSSSSYLGTQLYKRLKAVLWKIGTNDRFQQGMNCKRGFQSPEPFLKEVKSNFTIRASEIRWGSYRTHRGEPLWLWEFKGSCWAMFLGTWDGCSKRQDWLVRVRAWNQRRSERKYSFFRWFTHSFIHSSNIDCWR